MEIKIMCTLSESKEMTGTTYLFEGTDIRHEFHYYDNRERLIEFMDESNYTERIGIPSAYLIEDKEIPGYYLRLTFNHKDQWTGLVIKYATVFITNNGQTVDKIIVD